MKTTRDTLHSSISKAVKSLEKRGDIKDVSLSRFKIEHPRQGGQGDYSTSAAMQLASSSRKKPITIAELLVEELKKDKNIKNIASDVQIAGPGFINFYLNENYLQKALKSIFNSKKYGKVNVGKGKKCNLEFISVNPVGELHVGNARTAFYGDVLGNVLELAGFDVTREYYVNNAKQSAQIKELGKTALGEGTSYKSHYLDKKIRQHAKSLKRFKDYGAAGHFLARKIQKDIERFLEKDAGIKFDVWMEEESLYKKGEVDSMLEKLKRKGLTYERDGAVWLKTTEYGDTQDQVLVRSNGENTYFLADIAYHNNKLKRNFKYLIDIWGADHQGHVKKMKAAMDVLNHRDIEILIAQMVRLKGGGKLSKRKGTIVTLKDLLDATGNDAVRYFYIAKSLDSQMEFDISLAKKQSQKNPIYYIQYTHARICSIVSKAGVTEASATKSVKLKNVSSLKEEGEMQLIKQLTRFPEVVEDAATDYQVHRLATYLLETAQEFNQFYRDFRVIGEDTELQQARLLLAIAAGVIIRECLDLLGINAPERM